MCVYFVRFDLYVFMSSSVAFIGSIQGSDVFSSFYFSLSSVLAAVDGCYSIENGLA